MKNRTRPLSLAGGLLVLLAGIVFLWFVVGEQQRLHNAELNDRLLVTARLLGTALRAHWPDIATPEITGLVDTLHDNGTDVVVARADGTFLLDTTQGHATPAELRAAPEVVRALREGHGVATRPWGRSGREHMLVAAEVASEQAPLGVIWLARPVWSILDHPGELVRSIALLLALAALLALAFVTILFRLRRRMFGRVVDMARSLSLGDLSNDLEFAASDELAVLSSALNTLRRRLSSQIETIDRQRRMLQALVDQLTEGVVVAGADGRIALINPAARGFLSLGEGTAARGPLVGRPVEACIREHAVQQMLLPTPADADDEQAAKPALDEAHLEVESVEGHLHLLARASRLDLAEWAGDDGPAAGRVVVLTDITELERTIEVRTDFVANASHELRTPLATIRAAVETLLTIDLAHESDAAMQFLRKIDRHSERLQQMVADLLDLSRLESPTERFEPEPVDVRRFLQDLRFRFADALERKELNWEAVCEPEDLRTIHANTHLLRLVLDNLVDNALKFTDAGGHVRVRIVRAEAEVQLEVRDDGCGIPEEDQQRVFERFYQVERARSGAARGTGLGLSIVRHAVGALHGDVELESAPGRGTCARVIIPQPT